MTSYLRVKKWKDWQHYKDREPPWVKLHSKLLRDDDFLALSEPVQWQLVRVWMVASQSSRFTLDENKRVVPVVVNDESTIRRATASLKKVPLVSFIEQGWLILVAEELTFTDSSVIAPGKPESSADASPLLEVEGRDLERSSSKGSGSSGRPNLPIDEHLMDKLVTLCLDSADDGTEAVLRAYASRLPQSSLAKVIETTAAQPAAIRSRYANSALRSEIEERSVA